MSPHLFIIFVREYKSGTQQLFEPKITGVLSWHFVKHIFSRIVVCTKYDIIKLADKEELFLPIKGIRKNDKTVILVKGNKQRH